MLSMILAASLTSASNAVSSITSNFSFGFKSSAPTSLANATIPSDLIVIFADAEKKYGVSWAVLAAMVKVETDFQDKMLFKIDFSKLTGYEIDGNGDGKIDFNDKWDQIHTIAHFLSKNNFKEDPAKALRVYNARLPNDKRHYNYASAVLKKARSYSPIILPSEKGIWPVPGHTRITSEFGMRRDPGTKKPRLHKGIDIAGEVPGIVHGAPVVAVADGRIIKAMSVIGGYGKYVVIDHGGYLTLYAHLDEIHVNVGNKVRQGEQIGTVGNTGRSFGSHLHFEVIINGRQVNPLEWLEIGDGNY